MKILEYTLGLPPFRRGGLPRYSTDLSEELAKTNEVYLMYPGQINPYSKKIKLVEKRTKYYFKTVEIKNSLPVSLGLGIRNEKYYMEKRDISVLKAFVDKIAPDVVHFHTLMGIPKEFLEYLHDNKIRTIYTTHDFYGLCPKMLKKNPKKKLASSKCSYDCMLCNLGPSYKKVVIMQSHLYENIKENKLVKKLRKKNKTDILNEDNVTLNKGEVELRYKLRQYYLEMFNLIDVFHFNSTVSKKYFQKFMPKIKGKVIPITHGGLSDDRLTRCYHYNRPIRLGYVGPYDKKKGFFMYTQILQDLEKNYNFKADFYGDIVDRSVFRDIRFINHGIISSNELKKEYKNMDVLIVPSLWHETFGYVVLEALLEGTPCLVSKNVGSKDLVPVEWHFNNLDELREKLINIIQSNIVQKMRVETDKLNLSYEMDKHVKIIVEELYN